MVLTVAFPLLYMIIISFKSRNEFAANPYDVINTKWTIDNYIKMFADYHVQKNYGIVFLFPAQQLCLFAYLRFQRHIACYISINAYEK